MPEQQLGALLSTLAFKQPLDIFDIGMMKTKRQSIAVEIFLDSASLASYANVNMMRADINRARAPVGDLVKLHCHGLHRFLY